MEQFRLLEGDRTLKASREQINDALLTVRSLSSGTTFPTTDLSDGMLCYRTDHGRLYQLADAANNIWTDRIAMSIAGTANTADTIAWANIVGKPTAYPAEEHAHTYAGSLTEGGSATKAEALATPRTINGTPFDGTADITVTVPWSNIENKPASYASADKLTTAHTINGIPFDGTADIAIPIPPAPKAYVTTTWKSGSSWYRVWSDGWVEQGGCAASGSLPRTITLSKAMADTNYTITTSVFGATGDSCYSPRVTGTKTQLTIYGNGNTLKNSMIAWSVCGEGA